MTTRRETLHGMAAGTLSLLGMPAFAQDDKGPITVLVGAGSTIDSSARLIAEQMRSVLGRPVIVVSKLGAGGRVALGELKRSAPDGKTLMYSSSSPFAIYPNIYTKLDYDPVADFTPIAGIAWFDVGIAVGPASPYTDLGQVIAAARTNVQSVLYGAPPGAGSSSHFAGIATELATGVKLGMVPYKDSSVAIADVISGRLPLIITGTGAMSEMHKAGKLRVLATTGPARSPLLPDVPTFREKGVDVSIVNSTGLYGPARMPQDLVDRLHASLAPLFGSASQREKLDLQGMAPDYTDAKKLAASLVEDRKHFELLAKRSGYVPEAS